MAEGLFHGIQTALFAQQMAARAQFEQMRRQAIESPAEGGGPVGGGATDSTSERTRHRRTGRVPGGPTSLGLVIDLKALRGDPEVFRASQVARGEDPGVVDLVLASDLPPAGGPHRNEALRAEQKALREADRAAAGAVKRPGATAEDRATLAELLEATSTPVRTGSKLPGGQS